MSSTTVIPGSLNSLKYEYNSAPKYQNGFFCMSSYHFIGEPCDIMLTDLNSNNAQQSINHVHNSGWIAEIYLISKVLNIEYCIFVLFFLCIVLMNLMQLRLIQSIFRIITQIYSFPYKYFSVLLKWRIVTEYPFTIIHILKIFLNHFIDHLWIVHAVKSDLGHCHGPL